MAGVYFVAAELARRGFIASPTSRSAHGVDLLVAHPDGVRTFAVEVKTNAATFSFWLLGAKALEVEAPTLFYALVNLRKLGNETTSFRAESCERTSASTNRATRAKPPGMRSH